MCAGSWCWLHCCTALVYSLRTLTARFARCSRPSFVLVAAAGACSALFTLVLSALFRTLSCTLSLSAIYSGIYSATLLRRCSLALTLRYPLVLALALIARH